MSKDPTGNGLHTAKDQDSKSKPASQVGQSDEITPRVTWLIPVKNGMPYLPETLASIEAQTYRNWEVMIWDNGSTDGTLEELAKWIPDRLPGRVISDQPMGLALSRAAQVELAETEFCALIDADDVNLPDRLEKQVAYLVQHPEIAAVGGQLRRLDAHSVDQGAMNRLPTDSLEILYQFAFRNPMAQPAVLFRKSAAIAVGNYRYVGAVNIEDYDLWMRVAASGYQLANLPDDLVRYRVHERSTTQDSLRSHQLDSAMEKVFAEAAGSLFGLKEAQASEVYLGKVKRMLPVMNRIASHLDTHLPLPDMSHRRHPLFLKTFCSRIHSSDYTARLFTRWERLIASRQVQSDAANVARRNGHVG